MVGSSETRFTIEEPTAPDAAAIALVHTQGWREAYGTGVGQALLEGILGERPAFLWVAEQNPRARRFYEKNGFRFDGTTKIDDRFNDLAEIRMTRP